MNDARFFNSIRDFENSINKRSFELLYMEINRDCFSLSDLSGNLFSCENFCEFKKKANKHLKKWKDENCEKFTLQRNICCKCFYKNLEGRTVGTPESRKGYITKFDNDWDKGKVFCLKLTRNQRIKNPYLKDCPYKLEHLLKGENNEL